jgi:hypothetical protein
MDTSNKSISKIINFSEILIQLMAWEKSNLPIEQSALALDLFLVIVHNTLRDRPLTLKQLFNSVDFSEAGIRKHLKRLLAEGWCSLEGSAKDKRLRLWTDTQRPCAKRSSLWTKKTRPRLKFSDDPSARPCFLI